MTGDATVTGVSRSTRTEDRAVSDIVGFAVVFGIAILSVTLIYTVGIAALNDLQHGEAMNNADRAFDIVADNMADIHRNGAPARSTELQFPGGQMAVTGQVNLTINVVGQNAIVPSATSVTPISYHRRETGFHYVSGAVIRTDRNQSVIVHEPPFRFGTDRTFISFVSTGARGDTASAGGEGSIHLSARRDPPGSRTQTATVTNGNDDVTFEIHLTSPRFRAWERYFERQGLTHVETDAANNTVIFNHTTDELHVRKTKVAVRLTA